MNFNFFNVLCPTDIVTVKLGIPLNYKQRCIDEAYKIGDSMGQTTNVKGIMSSYLVFNQTKVYNKLLINIENIINSIEIFQLKDSEFQIVNAWSAIYKKDHHSIKHHHKPSFLSFVYYLQSSGNTPLIFDECNFKINPVDDMLVIFPSYTYHSVPPHNYQEDRICVAGNLEPFGTHS
jgi:hypothetical protein